jgi:hypothetical protein
MRSPLGTSFSLVGREGVLSQGRCNGSVAPSALPRAALTAAAAAAAAPVVAASSAESIVARRVTTASIAAVAALAAIWALVAAALVLRAKARTSSRSVLSAPNCASSTSSSVLWLEKSASRVCLSERKMVEHVCYNLDDVRDAEREGEGKKKKKEKKKNREKVKEKERKKRKECITINVLLKFGQIKKISVDPVVFSL